MLDNVQSLSASFPAPTKKSVNTNKFHFIIFHSQEEEEEEDDESKCMRENIKKSFSSVSSYYIIGKKDGKKIFYHNIVPMNIN